MRWGCGRGIVLPCPRKAVGMAPEPAIVLPTQRIPAAAWVPCPRLCVGMRGTRPCLLGTGSVRRSSAASAQIARTSATFGRDFGNDWPTTGVLQKSRKALDFPRFPSQRRPKKGRSRTEKLCQNPRQSVPQLGMVRFWQSFLVGSPRVREGVRGLPPYLPRSFRIRRRQFGAPQSHWNGEAISDSFTR